MASKQINRIQLLMILILTALHPSDSNSCGRRPLMSEYGSSRIVGGVDAQPGAWPWLVSIQVPSGGGHRHSCGGTLIDEQWVLTAAHCFKTMKRLVSKWQIILGGFQLSDPSRSDVQIRSIDSYVQHEHYNPRTERNDVALIKLNQTVRFTDFVQPACLPSDTKDIHAMDHCYISGWGVTKDKTIQTADILQEAKVNQIPLERCNGSAWYNGEVHDYNLCAGYEEGGIDSCQGDSGGPFMCMDPDSSTYNVIGVTSWGEGCGKYQKPGVYSNTQYYREWILKTMGTPSPALKEATGTPSLSGSKAPLRPKPTRPARTMRPAPQIPTVRPTRRTATVRPTRWRPTVRPTRWRPTVRPTRRRPTVRPAQQTQPAQQAAWTMPGKRKPRTRPAQRATWAMPGKRKPRTRPAQRATWTMPAQRTPGTQNAQRKPRTRPAQHAIPMHRENRAPETEPARPAKTAAPPNTIEKLKQMFITMTSNGRRTKKALQKILMAATEQSAR
ncbi:acrosin-like [Spea bombifrons]|uniref:acrosin-like n=1 Tax=Spea bombifrons TaxID=233779 RepID=UPI002349DE41|nr:acrosin-like [Spea bombifrons]